MRTSLLSTVLGLTLARSKGVGAPIGYGFLRIGTPASSQLLRIGSDNAAPRILIPTEA